MTASGATAARQKDRLMLRKLFLVLSLLGLVSVPGPAFSSGVPDAIFADGSGPVEVIIFSDYFCPPCQALEPYLEAALPRLHQSGIRITFVDMPVHALTPLFSRYFLYAANAADSFRDKLHIRRKLFDIAQTGAVASERELIHELKENRIELARLDLKPLFDQWVALINRFAVRSTPTCAVIQPGQEVITYSGRGNIQAGIDRLIEALPTNP